MAFSKEMREWGVMWVLKEEHVRFKQLGREFQKHNEQCPTKGMNSDQPEQIEKIEKANRAWNKATAMETEKDKCNKPPERSFTTLTAQWTHLGNF